MIHLDHRDARPIYAQIADSFRQQIAAGVLLPGEKLPSVRELAAQLSINPNTIQRAYRELELSGWIASATGKGSFVCGIPANSDSPMLEEFDRICAALLAAGISRQQLLQRLSQGGTDHA